MNKDRLAQLIARKLSGEAAEEELKELEDFLRDHPADNYFVSLLHDYWETPVSAGDTEDPESHIRHIFEAAEENTPVIPLPDQAKNRFTWKIPAVAAAVLAVIITSYFIMGVFKTSHPSLPLKREVVARSGSKSRLLLPDGSTVWLNAESRLSYAPNFTDSLREVDLEGEAYFDVVKNSARPFIVHASGVNIRVLGTAFNVRSYPHDHAIVATLIRGLIQVTTNDSRDHAILILHPHEKVIVPKSGEPEETGKKESPVAQGGVSGVGMVIQQLKKETSDTAVVETAWVYNKLVFDGNTFREIADELERQFNIKIAFHDEAVARYRFHAGFENENIHEVLAALQVSSPFTFKIHNDEVEIYKK